LLDINKIRQLIEMMVSHDLVEISLRDGEEEISLRRPHAASPESLAATAANPGGAASAPSIPALAKEAPAAPASIDDGLMDIRSPMVGTFYASPDPDSPPFVSVGGMVGPGTVVCILEAMKVYNEIKSEIAGRVERVLVKNAQAVEYDQPLFLIRPQ